MDTKDPKVPNTEDQQSYEAPDLFQIGTADELILGSGNTGWDSTIPQNGLAC
jgi:hypothetical protein